MRLQQSHIHSLLLGLADLVLWRVLEDVGVQAVAHVNIGHRAACLALEENVVLPDLHHSLWVAAGVALHILLDESLRTKSSVSKLEQNHLSVQCLLNCGLKQYVCMIISRRGNICMAVQHYTHVQERTAYLQQLAQFGGVMSSIDNGGA
jgi:hypothetical protein